MPNSQHVVCPHAKWVTSGRRTRRNFNAIRTSGAQVTRNINIRGTGSVGLFCTERGSDSWNNISGGAEHVSGKAGTGAREGVAICQKNVRDAYEQPSDPFAGVVRFNLPFMVPHSRLFATLGQLQSHLVALPSTYSQICIRDTDSQPSIFGVPGRVEHAKGSSLQLTGIRGINDVESRAAERRRKRSQELVFWQAGPSSSNICVRVLKWFNLTSWVAVVRACERFCF
ncbi:hypothetical protein K438DRAFT_1753157 [Mycena galopus ATCC 62051]|nr:hypothetical protein K438DRAFT_1753157 [Mycena galopus ATCC 62051]